MKDIVKSVFKHHDWAALPVLHEWVIEQAIAVQQIPAPTFSEAKRGEYVRSQFTDLGLQQVSVDDSGNVYGLRPGLNAALPRIMVTAHLDTVFSEETNLDVRYADDLIYGPGLGDNSLGIAGLLGLLKWLNDTDIKLDCDIWVVATVGEEGLGDLFGMRAAYERLRDGVACVINLEGLAYGYVYHAGIAVQRLHITAHAEGGHSWVHYGRPSAVHALLQLGAQIAQITPPKSPRTTLNIGMIEGGHAINAIGTQAGLWLDLRSESQVELDRLVGQAHRLIRLARTPDIRFEAKIVGNRPAGYLTPRHPLIVGAMTALEELGVKPSLETGSTDGNIPLRAGCPTVTIGISKGANAHRLDEYIEVTPVADGMRQLISLVIAAAVHQRVLYEQAAGD